MNIPVRRYFALLMAYLKPQWLKTFCMIICLLAGIAFQLVNPPIIGYFINTLGTHGPAGALMAAAGLYIIAALLNEGISVASTYFRKEAPQFPADQYGCRNEARRLADRQLQ